MIYIQPCAANNYPRLAFEAAPAQIRCMRIKSIAAHLRPCRMLANRQTTINHMFAAAVAPNEQRVRAAVALLGNDSDGDPACAYCGEPAETWDHVSATVERSRFSGHGTVSEIFFLVANRATHEKGTGLGSFI
jgi:hypothetical protein